MVNSAGQLMLGYCVQILIGSGSHVYHPCDEHDGTMDGVVHFYNLPNPPDQRAAADTPYPPNYLPGPEVPLVFDADGHAEATYVWAPATGVVTVVVRKPDGSLAPGACFSLYATAQSPSSEQRQCDINDGLFDGVTTFSSVPAGHSLRPFRAVPRRSVWLDR